MLSRVNGSVMWMEDGVEGGEEDEDAAVSWTRSHLTAGSGAAAAGGIGMGEGKDELGLATFKSILGDDWSSYFSAAAATTSGAGFHNNPLPLHHHPDIVFPVDGGDPSPAAAGAGETMLLPAAAAVVDSSSSCSPSSVFTLDPSSSSSQPFFPAAKSSLSSLLNVVCSNPFDAAAAFDLGCDASNFLTQMPSSPVLMNRGGGGGGGGVLGFAGLGPDLSPPPAQFPTSRLMPPPPISENGAFSSAMGFGSFENSPFLNRAKVLRPLEIFPPVGAQPTLFQKRAAALRQNSGGDSAGGSEKGASLGFMCGGGEEEQGKRRRWEEEDELDEGSIDGSGLNYDSDEAVVAAENGKAAADESGKNGNNSNLNSSTVTAGGGGDQKGKRKGLPAKNLMAERRRRKKLNDRLYMLRSVVPKISKMDRASILGDAIEYLKELLQRINDLHNELESTPSGSSLPPTTTASFHPLTPTPPTLPCRVKEELCPSSLPSPNNQPPKVEVREREGRAVNIHMFCARRPGLLLSTMRALDGLGLDIQQAVISCFNGFALDIFRAEQLKDGPGVPADDIRAVLLHSAGFHGAM